MMSPTDDESVRLALDDMLRAGQLRRPPLSGAELRHRGERSRLPRVDVKALVALAAAAALVVVFFTVQPLHHVSSSDTPAATPSVPSGWVAHSAYGLQLAAPRTWSVQVFGQCPDGSRPGTLFIGTPPYAVFCPEYGSTTTQVTMYRSADRPPPTGRLQGSTHILRVHGLSVTSSRTDAGLLWTISSMHVTITGSGPNALPIMQSLAPATRRASPAIGKVTGSEYLEALVRAPVSGPVRVRPPSGTPFEVEAVDGQFSFTGPPGTYLLTGHDGNVSCPPVSVTVHSGESATALPIQCNGD